MKKIQRTAKNRRGRYVRKCPVEIGNEYTVNIIDKTPNGAGIAKIKGFLILVDGTRIGDHIKVKITQTDSLSAEAELIA